MNLSEKVKLNMELAYVPVAKLKDVQQMMSDWRENNKKIRICSFAACATSVISASNFMYDDKTDECLINYLVALMFLIAGVFVTKSSRVVYAIPFIALVVFSVLPVQYIDMTIRTFFMITVFLPALIGVWFSYKALFNYKNVYIPLSKRKGFPNFVFSTADMYGSKMYLKNKDKETVAEKRVSAAFNPFNKKQDIKEEEIERMNTLRYEELKTIEQNIDGGEYYEEKEVKHSQDQKKKYKHGFSIYGIDIIIPHNDIKGAPKEENRRLMFYWNDFKRNMFKNEVLWLFLFSAAIMVYMWTEGSISGLLLYLFLGLYVLGTNYIKQEKLIGFPLVLCIYGYVLVPSMFIAPVVLFLFTVIKLPGYIRWLLNYNIYKQLSKEQGFPSFVENTADLYGEKLYIIEKDEAPKKLPKLNPITMDIGYEDDKKKDKGWNAFDYLEQDKENSAYDDFEYYEQAYEARRKAKPLENQKPDKDMGRKKRDED